MSTSHTKSSWVAGILAALVLTTGVALALETVGIDLPAGEHVVVDAVMMVDEGGATLFGTRPVVEGDDVVDFSVVFDETTGECRINGGAPFAYNPGTEHHVTAVCREIAGDREVDIMVRDENGQVIGMVVGAAMGGMPTRATATAADVVALTAE